MNSLRSRLTLGIALAAIVPLAIVMVLQSQRIEHAVREDAATRLDATLGTLRNQLASDGERMTGQLEIISRDAVLKRYTLLRPAGDRDLPEYLAQQRFLLGLDFLSVVDTSGVLIADAGMAAPRGDDDAWRQTTFRGGSAQRGVNNAPSSAIDTLSGGAGLVLDASAAILYEDLPVGMLRGGRALDAAFLARLKHATGVDLVLRDSLGGAMAATFADSLPVPSHELTGVQRIVHAGKPYLTRDLTLDIGPEPRARISGFVATTAADATIAALRWTALLLGVLGLLLAVLLGVVWSSQVSKPVQRLVTYSDRLARGEWDLPLELKSVHELEALVASLNHMRTELTRYRDRLIVSERHEAWSLMARKVAHEVKNPLTPIAISIADLKRSYELGRPEFSQILEQAARTVAEEVESLKRILNEFSEFARIAPPQFERVGLAQLIAGIATLYQHEVKSGRFTIALDPTASDASLEADAAQLRQALVNLVKNALEAIAANGNVTLAATRTADAVEITVADDGPGLSTAQRAQLFVPEFTTKTEGSGLGLTITQRIISDHRGTIRVDPAGACGTTFRIVLPLTQSAVTNPNFSAPPKG